MNFNDDAALRRIYTRAKDCPEGEVVDALRDTVIEFCTKTQAITNSAQVVTTAEATEAVALDMTGFTLLDIVDAQIDGESVPVLAANDEAIEDATADQPAIVYGGDVSSAVLVPTPDAPVTLDLLVVVAPGPEATEFPDFLWQRHYRALCDGAIAALCAQTNRPWSDPGEALLRRASFQAAVNAAAALYGRNRVTRAQLLRTKPA